jgi:hypothetical protein
MTDRTAAVMNGHQLGGVTFCISTVHGAHVLVLVQAHYRAHRLIGVAFAADGHVVVARSKVRELELPFEPW